MTYLSTVRESSLNQLLKMFKGLLLYFALLLWFVVPSSAQLTIISPELIGKKGETIDVDISVEGFSYIVAAQFTIQWDPNVVKFVETTNFNLPLLSAASFGTTQAEDGKLFFLWIDNSVSGINLADNDSMFTIRFELIGEKGESSPLEFVQEPTSVVFGMLDTASADYQVINLDVTAENGSIMIDDLTAISQSLENEQFVLFQNEPNPFNKVTQIPFKLKNADYITLKITDLAGKEIYAHSAYYQKGLHQVPISPDFLPTTGTYFYSIQTSKHLLIKKMMLMR